MPLKYNVRPSRLDLRGLTKVNLPGRPIGLPPLYKMNSPHSLLPEGIKDYTAYIAFIDPSDAGKKHWDECTKDFGIPYGPEKQMREQNPGMYK